MEPLKRCALLALALLQVAVLAEDSGCGGEATGCRVVRGGGEQLAVECGVLLDLDQKTVEDAINKTIGNSSDNGSSISCNINDTWCENSNKTAVDDNLKFVNSNVTEFQTKPYFASDDSHRRILNGSKSASLLTASSVTVSLLGKISALDLSYYLSAKTLILNTNSFHIARACGANNISALTVTTSSSIDFNFVKSFTNLKFLNLSHNKLETFTDSGFPLMVFSIDLSFNKITLNKNVSLPQTLRVFNVSYNNISIDKDFILKGNVIVLDIRGNKLDRVPLIEMETLEELYLSRNYIKILKEKTFVGLLNLTILDLRANRLSDIEEQVFQGLNRLQWLDLSENNLMSLAPATFQYLSNLVTLLLSKNVNLGNLQDIEDASLLFGTGQRLREIEASNTNLSRIPSTVTRSVRKLLLTDNTICTIQCGEVDSFPLLQVIDVSNNMISEIEEDALGRLEFLTELLLSGNKLLNTPKSLPGQLQVLDLRCNSINKLNNVDFLGLQKLRVLLLSMNNISVIEDGAFGQLISLEVLDLSYNPIKTLYRSSFTGPRRLKELYLISLKELTPLKEPLSFPAPESSHLEVVIIDSSPELATRLMDDAAALTMFHELYELSLRDCKLQSLRSDLPSYLPRLQSLQVTNNPLNCTDIMWLVQWMRSLNDYTKETVSTKRNTYSNPYRICKENSEQKILLNDDAKCASPKELLGQPISSIKGNFPHATTKSTSSTTERLAPELTTESKTVSREITIGLTNHDIITLNSDPHSDLHSTLPSVNELVTLVHMKNPTVAIRFNSTHSKQKSIKMQNTMNKLQNTWKYSKNQSKYTSSTVEPFIVLLNDTKHSTEVIDNQVNESLTISHGAFLAHAHDPPPTSHPGMMVFLLVVGVILAASSAMVYSHCRQIRRSSQYQHHQDIEVASFGGHELW